MRKHFVLIFWAFWHRFDWCHFWSSFPNCCSWIPFLNSFCLVFGGKLIPIINYRMKSKSAHKCNAHIFLHTILDTCSFFFIFSLFQMAVHGYHSFCWRIHSHGQKYNGEQKVLVLASTFSHLCTFFGCLWIPFLYSFCLRFHSHSQKYN